MLLSSFEQKNASIILPVSKPEDCVTVNYILMTLLSLKGFEDSSTVAFRLYTGYKLLETSLPAISMKTLWVNYEAATMAIITLFIV